MNHREAMVAQAIENDGAWDIIIVGGGATGLGAAVDAASRGYRTLILEQADWGKGTSSRSTKLIHGGVRYLRQGHFMLVRDALRERGLLIRNAPHVVWSMPFVIPAYRRLDKAVYGIGLKLYDRMSGSLSLGTSRFLRADDVMDLIATASTRRLRGGVQYFDAQFDDARLIISLLRTFTGLGGTAVNYWRAAGLLKSGGRVCGVSVVDEESGKTHELRARAVVNASGVFVDDLRFMDDPTAEKSVTPSQGAHIVVPKRFLPGSSALMVPKTDDGRVIFAIPWHGHVMIGTTDASVERPVLEPAPMSQEIDYLLGHIRRYLSPAPGTDDVQSVFAGLRPLVRPVSERRTKKITRDHTVMRSESGLVSITGGKWTTYRKMAEDVVSEAAVVGALPSRPSGTSRLPLHGAGGNAVDDEWMRIYGSDAESVNRLCRSRPDLEEPIHPELPYRMGEVLWAIRYEMARSVEDVLARRTRALFLNARAAAAAARKVANLMADELNRGDAWATEQVRSFSAVAENYMHD